MSHNHFNYILIVLSVAAINSSLSLVPDNSFQLVTRSITHSSDAINSSLPVADNHIRYVSLHVCMIIIFCLQVY